MQKMVHPQEQFFVNEEITSPFGGQIFDFYESELFPETLQNSEVASNSNCCGYEEHSSNPTNLSITMDHMNNINYNINNSTIYTNPTTTGASTPATIATTNSNPSTFSDDQIILENDISASIDFTPSPSFSLPDHNHHHQKYFNKNSINQELPFSMSASLNNQQFYAAPERRQMVVGPPLPAAFVEADSLQPVPSYLRLGSSNLPDPMINGLYNLLNHTSFAYDYNSGTGAGDLLLGNDYLGQELDFRGDSGGFFLPDSIARVFSYSTGDLQALSSESEHLLHGSPSTTLASDFSSLEDPNFKMGKLSVEERKRKIHRYLKKRNERNFSKKIKYACRKTLADSRPRVRGRFAKNDELGDIGRTGGSNHEDTDEDVILFSNYSNPNLQHKVTKDEEGMEPADIFAHISGVSSFKRSFNCPSETGSRSTMRHPSFLSSGPSF